MVEADAPKNAGFPRCLVDIMGEKGEIVLFNEKFASWEEALEAFIIFKKVDNEQQLRWCSFEKIYSL